MSDTATLAFEIGTEEIPAFDLKRATEQLAELVPASLDAVRIPHGVRPADAVDDAAQHLGQKRRHGLGGHAAHGVHVLGAVLVAGAAAAAEHTERAFEFVTIADDASAEKEA